MQKKQTRVILPREHGSWFLLFVPFFSGAVISRTELWKIALLTGSVLFAFLAMTPAMLWVKAKSIEMKRRYRKWMIAYGAISVILGVILLPSYPMLLLVAAIGLLASFINFAFIKAKAERHILNDFVGVISLNSTFLASYYLGNNRIDSTALHELAYFLLFFLGSTFHIKSLIREKHNSRMKQMSIVYAISIFLLFWYLHAPVWIQIGQGIALLRVVLIPQNTKLKVLEIGILEILNGVLFGILFTLSFA
jgi:hypothetical protein